MFWEYLASQPVVTAILGVSIVLTVAFLIATLVKKKK